LQKQGNKQISAIHPPFIQDYIKDRIITLQNPFLKILKRIKK